MPYVMDYATWMRLTDIPGKFRGPELRSVDDALEQYHKTNNDHDFVMLRRALHSWKMMQGFDETTGWVTHERNSRKAIETLDLQLVGLDITLAQSQTLADLADLPFYGVEAWAEAEAKMRLREARNECLVELFLGKRVVFDTLKLFKMANKLRKALGKSVSKTAAAAGLVTDPLVREAQEAFSPARAAMIEARDSALAPVMAARDRAMAPVLEARETLLAPAYAARNEAEEFALEIIRQILSEFPVAVAKEAFQLIVELVPEFVAELAATVAPYLSLVPGSAKAVTNTVKAVKQEYAWIRTAIHIHSGALRPNDPTAAAEAMLRMVERKRNDAERLAAIYATDVTVKAAAIAADAAAFGAPAVSGPVTPIQGMLTAVAKLTLVVFAFGRDVYEKHQANKILMDRSEIRISAEIFEVCPVLGCYFLACSNTSDIVNLLIEDVGSTGWQLDVEHLVTRHVRPLVSAAKKHISSSRLKIQELEGYKGSFKDPNKRKLKKKMLAKVGKHGTFEGFGKSPGSPFAGQ